MEFCEAGSCSVDDGEWQLDEIYEEADEGEDVSGETEGSDDVVWDETEGLDDGVIIGADGGGDDDDGDDL